MQPGLVQNRWDARPKRADCERSLRTTEQRGIIALLHRSVERVHVAMNYFSHDFPETILIRAQTECNRAAGRLFTAVAVSSSNACSPERLFGSCDCWALPARAIYRVGGLRGRAYAIASDPSLAAYRFPDLGNSHGVAALALSVNSPRELARTKGGRRAVPGRLPAPLFGQARLSGYFRHRVDGGWSDRLRFQPGALWKANADNAALIDLSRIRA
jgi:hypothetical protein